MAALPTIMLLLHQMVAGSEGHQVGVVGRGRDGDGPGAPDVGVAQLVGQLLQLVSLEPRQEVRLHTENIVTEPTCCHPRERGSELVWRFPGSPGGSRDRSRTLWGE